MTDKIKSGVILKKLTFMVQNIPFGMSMVRLKLPKVPNWDTSLQDIFAETMHNIKKVSDTKRSCICL